MNEFNVNDFFTSEDDSDFIGRGSYASVRRCHHKDLGNVVVKCFNIGGSRTAIDRQSDHVRNEAEVLCRLKHDNIIKVYGVTKWSTCYGVVMEEASGHNLEDLVIHAKDKSIAWPLRLRLLSEIAKGLEYLHYHNPKRSYIHGDLKLQNILLTDNFVVKIADFGAVSLIYATGGPSASMSLVSSKQHTWLYSSPELLSNPGIEMTRTMDVYSYAMIGYEIITRHQVFISSGDARLDLIQQLIKDEGLKPDLKLINEVKGNLVNESDLDICCGLESIVIECWQTNPKDRPSIKEVKNKLKATSISKVITMTPNEVEHLKKFNSFSNSNKVFLSHFEFPFQLSTKYSYNSSSATNTSRSIEDKSNNQVIENLFSNFSNWISVQIISSFYTKTKIF